jgi:hypothetical protein
MTEMTWATKMERINDMKKIADTLRDTANYFRDNNMKREDTIRSLERQIRNLEIVVRKMSGGWKT